MTNETKKLFDAPWQVADDKDELGRYMVLDDDLACVAKESTLKDANRISHLPELYDALMEAAYEHCYNSCLVFIYAYAESVLEIYMIENGCPRKNDECEYCKVWELLKKVRDGK